MVVTASWLLGNAATLVQCQHAAVSLQTCKHPMSTGHYSNALTGCCRDIYTHRHPPRTCDRQLVHQQQPNGLPAAGPRITTTGQCSHVVKQECLHLFGQSRSTPGCFGAHAECTGSTQRLHTATSPTCDCRLVHEQQPNGLPAAADTRPEALLIV